MRLRACAGKRGGFVFCLAALVLLAVPLGGARAQDVHPGFDLYITDASNAEFDFGTQPVPADFFGPGSDPFDGVIALKGLPLPQNPYCPLPPSLCPNDDLTEVDTIVERLNTAVLPGIGSYDVIDTEIVALSLKSIHPITVTYSGGLDPELWDVHVCLSPTQATGNMLINKTHPDGGDFESDLSVVPLFIFTRVSDSEERILDGFPNHMDILEAVDVPWEYADPAPLSCRSNFCAPDPYVQAGVLATQGLLSTCGDAVPAMPTAGVIILIGVLASVGVYVIRRFGKEAA